MPSQTLLLTLKGPQQAWGSRSRFAIRSTEQAPTRSGVIGLIAAAMGMERTDSLDRLTAMKFGVRIDQPGRIERDFQTARTLDGKHSMPLSQRYFLADAVFLAGLESNDLILLNQMVEALRSPGYPLFLGRRAFPPAGPIHTEVVNAELGEALTNAPWKATHSGRKLASGHLDLLVEAQPGEPVDLSLEDDPVSFDPRRRRHRWRDIRILHVNPPGITQSTTPKDLPAGFVLPDHDPMLLASKEEF